MINPPLNRKKLYLQIITVALLILLFSGCAPAPPESTPTPSPPPAALTAPPPNANWQLYVIGTLVGDAAVPLVEYLALPEPAADRQWLVLKLTLENISPTWLALPAGGISGGLHDSAGDDLDLAGLNFAPYTRLPDGEDIAPAPRFQAAGLAWVKIAPHHTPTDIWLDIAGTETGRLPLLRFTWNRPLATSFGCGLSLIWKILYFVCTQYGSEYRSTGCGIGHFTRPGRANLQSGWACVGTVTRR